MKYRKATSYPPRRVSPSAPPPPARTDMNTKNDEPIEQTEMSQMKSITKLDFNFEISGDTLRDLFAAHALNAIVSHQVSKGIDSKDYAAVEAYDYADAMLIRRGK